MARLVSSMFERSHFRQAPVNDPVSSLMLDRYLESLDPSRSYFLASDIAEFERYRYQLDDAVTTGELEPAFAIFNRFQTRNRERMQFALAQLEHEPDLTIDEDFEFDRKDAPWAKIARRARRALAQARQERRRVAAARRQEAGTTARDVLRKRYERVLKRADQVTSDDVFENFMNAFAHVFDPHSSYFSPRNSEEYRIQMSLSYEGIGASLQLDDDFVTVVEILPGGSAQQSGAAQRQGPHPRRRPGQERRARRRRRLASRRRRAAHSRSARLERAPAGAARQRRAGHGREGRDAAARKITLEAQAAKKEVRTIQRGDEKLKVGIINVPSFYQDYNARAAGDDDYRSTTKDVRHLIDELKAEGGVDSLVLDLRSNGGGHLSEAIGLVNLFVPKGPVVQLRRPAAAPRSSSPRTMASPTTGRSRSSSIASAPRRRRSSPPRCRTTAAAS